MIYTILDHNFRFPWTIRESKCSCWIICAPNWDVSSRAVLLQRVYGLNQQLKHVFGKFLLNSKRMTEMGWTIKDLSFFLSTQEVQHQTGMMIWQFLSIRWLWKMYVVGHWDNRRCFTYRRRYCSSSSEEDTKKVILLKWIHKVSTLSKKIYQNKNIGLFHFEKFIKIFLFSTNLKKNKTELKRNALKWRW